MAHSKFGRTKELWKVDSRQAKSMGRFSNTNRKSIACTSTVFSPKNAHLTCAVLFRVSELQRDPLDFAFVQFALNVTHIHNLLEEWIITLGHFFC